MSFFLAAALLAKVTEAKPDTTVHKVRSDNKFWE